AEEIGKTLGSSVRSPGPETVRVDRSEGHTPASTDVGDVSWVVPTGAFTTATFVPGVAPHTWQATACAGTSIGRKGMLVAARTLALGGMGLFTDPGAVRAARASFEKRLAGRSWKTHIAAGSNPPLNYSVR